MKAVKSWRYHLAENSQGQSVEAWHSVAMAFKPDSEVGYKKAVPSSSP